MKLNRTCRRQLTNPNIDPRPLGRELLDIILPVDARKELAQAKAVTLMWHLDGPLRYLPLAALHDGTRYLVEQYRLSLFTAASYPNIKDQPKAAWKGLGLGVSESRTVEHKSFSALSSVPAELDAVIGQATNKGIVPGQQYLNNDFTWETMLLSLKKKGSYPLVHIASHFSLEPGNDTQSFLLPGKGDPITMALINKQSNLFGGVDLVTLSACETAYSGGKSADGKEVDGLSVLAQRQGAKAVIATLWPVADASTALLMHQFYKLREEKKLPKGEALRQAQLTLLNGMVKGTGKDQERAAIRFRKSDKATGTAPTFIYDTDKPFSHPYYWAPFILMGNWK
jgi:CHAT domain-containing protein